MLLAFCPSVLGKSMTPTETTKGLPVQLQQITFWCLLHIVLLLVPAISDYFKLTVFTEPLELS